MAGGQGLCPADHRRRDSWAVGILQAPAAGWAYSATYSILPGSFGPPGGLRPSRWLIRPGVVVGNRGIAVSRHRIPAGNSAADR